MLWALVPVKEPRRSKRRLAKVLDPSEREGLVLAMLRDVLMTIHDITEFGGVLVISRSVKARMLAQRFGFETFVESAGSDHSRAVTEANCYLIDRYGPQTTLALPCDVPLMTVEDIHQIVAQHDRVTLVPNESGDGTNAVLASPPNIITYHFGEQSLRMHTLSAAARGVIPKIVQNANIAKDVDEPHDLLQVQAALPPSFTRDYLENSGIVARISGNGVSTLAGFN